ncbi:MAG: TIGR04211 family SH3 domain-containing protein [Gammaproteobacteria bacterium]
MANKLLALLILLILFPISSLAETIFVTDSLKLKLRVNASNDADVVTSLDSGQKLTLIEKQKRFTKVKTSDGEQGWVQSWFLTDKPPATYQLATVTKENESLTSKLIAATSKLKNFDSETLKENDQLKTAVASLSGKIESLTETRNELQSNLDTQASELAKYEFANKYNLNLIILVFFLFSFIAGVVSYRIWSGVQERKRLWGYQLAH